MVALRTFVATVEHARLIPLARVRLGLPEISVKKVGKMISLLKNIFFVNSFGQPKYANFTSTSIHFLIALLIMNTLCNRLVITRNWRIKNE